MRRHLSHLCSTAGMLVTGAFGFGAETKEFRNSLGMVFGPVKGIDVRISIHETRVADWNAYVEAEGIQWNHRPRFAQDGSHPAVNVTLGEALAFCEWLTGKEQASGLLDAAEYYRLPTNGEWDAALSFESIPAEGNPVTAEGRTPFPWGREWPPPRGSGNYNSARIDGAADDGFRFTAPVGTFSASPAGIFDLGGNVSEWVLEPDADGSRLTATLRGGSWMHFRKDLLNASSRVVVEANTRTPGIGFRCVLGESAEPKRPDTGELAAGKAQPAQPSEKTQMADNKSRGAVLDQTAIGAPAAAVFTAVPGQPFENSLGMNLRPLKTPAILLGEHEVRVTDYRRFLLDVRESATTDSMLGDGGDHPITGVSWRQAEAFCRWLTQREQALGSIPQEAAYRLPRIAEWRAAVEGNSATGAAPVFAWGSAWPPPAGFGNVASLETRPVKSYQPNSGGFHDLTGNAAEWCADVAGDNRAYCGGSWKSSSRDELQIDSVKRAPATLQSPEIGFRVVLDFHGAGSSQP